MAYCDVSTSRMNWRVGSGGIRIGSDVTIALSVQSACLHFSDQSNGMSFFKRSVSGLAICAKLQIKGLWNPSTPSTERTSLTEWSISGQSLTPAIFDGSIAISPFPSCTLRNVVLSCSNSHFDGLRKYKCSSNRSSSLDRVADVPFYGAG